MRMKQKARLLFVLLLFAICTLVSGLAEGEEGLGIVGSDVNAVLASPEEFGIPIPTPEVKADERVWKSDEVTVGGVPSSYTIVANKDGEIVRASFNMRGKKNDLFNSVAEIEYDAADTKRAAQFVKSNTGKEASTIIGDAEFELSVLTSVSTSSISIGGWSKTSRSETKNYVLKIEYNDLLSRGGLVAKVTKSVNIRAKDNSDSARVGHADAGDELIVTQAYYSPKWHQINYNGQICYVSAGYCEIQEAE